MNSQYLTPFFTLSHATDTPQHTDSFHDSTYYKTGPKDVCLLISFMIVMAVLRDVLRLGVFEPFARWKLTRDLEAKRSKPMNGNGHTNGHANGHSNGHANGHSNGHANGNATKKELHLLRRSVLRFAEQGWPAIYYPVQWCFGLYINYHLPTRMFEPTSLWIGYPHIPIAAPIKSTTLPRRQFYTHQMLVLNAEARRKDHWQMMAHHVITVFLMGASYFFNFTRVGCLIMVLMDWCDIFFPIAKMTRYLNLPQIVSDSLFAHFIVSWFITRHVLFMIVIVSTYIDLPRLVTLEWAPHLGRFLSREYWIIFCACLTALEALQVLWFAMACRVAWRAITTGAGADDVRSDDEGEDFDEKKEQ
ncbi:TLC domain-containing protein [Roridomyces roridus]|uniref:TLC domain-containing protein n=1 Tax=Roridomyces roridus TaxID=1738132 RepID=A0AAD7C4L8_9AGAR|nr:TLC domain-containing protein [Roridomyces roridus]